MAIPNSTAATIPATAATLGVCSARVAAVVPSVVGIAFSRCSSRTPSGDRAAGPDRPVHRRLRQAPDCQFYDRAAPRTGSSGPLG
ncbi:hypothetical protein GCM10009864_16450 [Streptomyces lunalinharesii]|uniref:Uncharacterized protein n=1 Tax=Streptomyces lunalinharesii TaxID=333384 RepID=A0ABN3RHU8_9ACTN